MLVNRLLNMSKTSAIFYLLLGITLFLIIYPVSFLIFGSFWSGNPGGAGELTLDNYVIVFSDPKTFELLVNSLAYALGSALLGVSIATVLAFITTRTNAPLREYFIFIPILPIILPGMVDNLAWIYLFSPNSGLANTWWRNLTGFSDPLFNIYTIYGMIWVMGISLVPLAYLVISSAFRTMDPSLEETARISGSSLFSIFRKITIPLMLPAILSVYLLTFILAFESFETPAMIGLPAGIDVFMSQIYQAVVWALPPSYGLGTAYASIILVITMTAVFLYRKATSRQEKFQVITGKGYQPGILDLGKWKWAGTAVLGLYVFVHIVIVFGMVLILSFQTYWDPNNLFGNMTLRNYETVIGQRRIVSSLINSGVVSIVSATIVVIVAAILTYISRRKNIRGGGLLEGLGTLPLAFPGFILGLGLLWTFLTLPIGVYGTVFVLMLAFLVKYMPQGIRFANGALIQIQDDLEESSSITGAEWTYTVRKIILPLLKPALISAWIYIFVLTFRELSSIIFLVTPNNQVISAILWDLFVNGSVELLAATSMLLTLFLWTVVIIAIILFKVRFR
jgi:iron(III) transport system permease protein